MIHYTRSNNIRTGSSRSNFQIANEITTVGILAGSSDMCFFFTDEPNPRGVSYRKQIMAKCMCQFQVCVIVVCMNHERKLYQTKKNLA